MVSGLAKKTYVRQAQQNMLHPEAQSIFAQGHDEQIQAPISFWRIPRVCQKDILNVLTSTKHEIVLGHIFEYYHFAVMNRV